FKAGCRSRGVAITTSQRRTHDIGSSFEVRCVLAHARNNTLPLARVGARPAARRVCGGSRAPWAIGLERDAESGALLSVWGPSPSQVYAVGGNPESGAMVRFDGERWVDDALPDDFPLTDWIYD